MALGRTWNRLLYIFRLDQFLAQRISFTESRHFFIYLLMLYLLLTYGKRGVRLDWLLWLLWSNFCCLIVEVGIFMEGMGTEKAGHSGFFFYDDSLPPGSNWIQWALIHWFKDQCISPLSKMPETTLSSTFIFEWDCGSRFLSFLACKLLIEMKSLGLILNISPNCNLSRSFFILQLHHFPVSQQAAMRCRPTFPERHGCFIS